MKFTTSFPIPRHEQPISHDSSLLLLGSCFSQNIGDKLSYYGFDTSVNPFGVIFNPHSLRELMEKSLTDNFAESDVSETYSYLAHSDMDGTDTGETLQNMKKAGAQLKNRVNMATHILLTLGTSWVYELKATGKVVANCHQQPQSLFNKRLLTMEEIAGALQKIEALVQRENPHAQVIYTLSPVRHSKDGMVENMRSKSRLHEAIQQQCEAGKAYYFPAYEILMDELRDYRFYAVDMIHPNATAVDYVWLRFRESVLDTTSQKTMEAVAAYRKLQSHRPKDATAHEEQLRKSLTFLQNQYPNLNLS